MGTGYTLLGVALVVVSLCVMYAVKADEVKRSNRHGLQEYETVPGAIFGPAAGRLLTGIAKVALVIGGLFVIAGFI